MVGVPKSNACKTCRQRKVKCGQNAPIWYITRGDNRLTNSADERQPLCRRCARAGYSCEGYPDRTVWVDEGKRYWRQKNRSGDLYHSEATRAPQLSYPSRLTGLHDGRLASYLYDKFGTRSDDHNYKTWMEETCRGDSQSTAVLALNALAAVFFANSESRDKVARQHASTLYVRALKSLAQSLSEPASCCSYSNVSAVFALSLYELYATTQTFGWIQHAGGMAAMMQKLGPAYFAQYPAHGLFLLNRGTIITRAFAQHEPCFLAEEAWTTVPWQTHPETLTEQHRMLSLIARIPTIHSRAIELDAGGEIESAPAQLEQLVSDAVSLGKDIISWRMTWELDHPDCAWYVTKTPDGTSLNKHAQVLFGDLLWFSDRQRCLDILLYNCAMASVAHFQRRLPPGLLMQLILEDWPEVRRPLRTNDLLLPDSVTHPTQCAIEICKTSAYSCSLTNEPASHYDMLMPFGCSMTIFAAFKGYEPHFAWLAGMLALAADNTGLRIFEQMVSQSPSSAAEFDPNITKYVPESALSDAEIIMSVKDAHISLIDAQA